MSARLRWHTHFCGVQPDARLRAWLSEPDSLTARCQRHCRQFRVQLLSQGPGRRLADEPGGRELVERREVLLLCDGVPVIFARSVLAVRPAGRLSRWLAGLGSRSLGSLLFSYPGFGRTPIEFARLDRRDVLFRRAAAFADGEPSQLWARRSRHLLGDQQVQVTEVFLPAIAGLEVL